MNSSLQISRVLLFLLVSTSLLRAQTRQWVRVIDASREINRAKAEILLEFEVEAGYHIQSHRPEDPLLIPTELIFQWPEGIANSPPVFPPAEPFPLLGTETVLQVYSGLLPVRVPLQIEAGVIAGEYAVSGILTYQACDDWKCYFPRELPFTMGIRLKADIP
ncbi:protein-disulfide reductase DsbD domain-containing protein [Robiginitalea sp. SC105]|uniref:protein-disulfide reductase DsbD domain-containing protein n=1 Tax=Robiginitalea sp. SC105 TaxID=2762332 RepID=UPI00163A234C|nr:protein-disulfide reductase DsbD domain-containing protein [Robiginitalea sp. SC105]MBC2838128.1 hypothetical protein [Robiginitalea sp. SC105]